MALILIDGPLHSLKQTLSSAAIEKELLRIAERFPSKVKLINRLTWQKLDKVLTYKIATNPPTSENIESENLSHCYTDFYSFSWTYLPLRQHRRRRQRNTSRHA